jgi:hypothetical protein
MFDDGPTVELLSCEYTPRNETHASTTDPEARLSRKEEARLVYQGHVLTENRNGLVVTPSC